MVTIVILEERIYKESELIELIGTQKHIQQYNEKGHLEGYNKTTFTRRLDSLCQYKKYKGRRYRITQVYEYPIPSNINKMCKGLYGLMLPELVNILLGAEDYRVTLTLDQWAIQLQMVKKEYHDYKYCKDKLASLAEGNIDSVQDFYLYSSHTLQYYLLKSIEYLVSIGDIRFYKVGKVYTSEELVDQEGNYEVRGIHRDATEDERKYYEKILRRLDKEFNIKHPGERYFSNKSSEYKKELHEYLQAINIEMYYTAYELHITHPEKITILSNYIQNRARVESRELDQEFTELLINNSEKRFLQDDTQKYINRYSTVDNYKNLIRKYCELTILRNQ